VPCLKLVSDDDTKAIWVVLMIGIFKRKAHNIIRVEGLSSVGFQLQNAANDMAF
jgi:hypothetical protein